jgi:hypothetical protein
MPSVWPEPAGLPSGPRQDFGRSRQGRVNAAVRVVQPPARAPPDLAGPILASYRAVRDHTKPEPWLVWSLGLVVAAVQLAVAVPALLFGGNGDATRAVRDLGAWDAALAVAFLYAARRPSPPPDCFPSARRSSAASFSPPHST